MMTPDGLQHRSQLLQAIRCFFLENSYIEVDTPQRLPVVIPESNLIPFMSEGCFLQTSPELCMKRLLARGCERIFQICHCFRKEEHGRLHQSEFTMLEWYHRGSDYFDLMRQCEELFCFLAAQCAAMPGVVDDSTIRWNGTTVSLAAPWDRLTVADAFEQYAGVSVKEALLTDMFDELLVTEIEPHLGNEHPVFLYEYPVERALLARRSAQNPTVAERFELYVAGLELANGFSELVDPQEQQSRFMEEIAQIRLTREQKTELPRLFLEEIGKIDASAGIALGVDRLCMLFMGVTDIAMVLPFSFEEL
ncbi:MAG: EF-P lysine aminoacylase GenX [Desulfobulbus sp.]|nr:EF-P lysine aminoacylase GenX [Desulfobulbus sp.]